MSRADDTVSLSEAQGTDALFADVYERLKAMAGRQLARGRAGNTLDTTALVHDLYLRMNGRQELAFEKRAQFFAYAARAMRHLLTDHARQRLAMRSGADWLRVTLNGEHDEFAVESAERALALETALEGLERADARAARVVELRYFAGLTLEQVAENLGLARRTIDRDWRFAAAFLQVELS